MAAIWDSKKYNRINWRNRPSTATALGATNLNKIDVFCNDVDNALIQMDAGKLNIETANSMLASVSFDSETGKFTFKELDGTTYEYDLNLEKIPVSFTLTEDGILTMTTEDGTQWTCNIADLIKDYVFNDSDTIAFEKEFVEEDDEGKGSYHVTASVKAGSINESHLDPDYRSDILTYKNQALTAANDSLTYSKDSKRWAVGDAEYEGSATDNSKYYKEQAEAAKAAAEQARDEAQAATGAVVMAPGVLGVGKPDNTTIEVASDGTISAKEATNTSPGISRPDGATLGVEEGVMKMIADATSLLITDNQELVVEKQGEVAQETTTQALIDAIADKVANQLVTNTALTSQLANYVTKAMMSNVQVNDQNRVPTSSLAFSMNQAITELNSDLSKIDVYALETSDCNSALIPGRYICTDAANSPDEYGILLVSSISTGQWIFQEFITASEAVASKKYIRAKINDIGWTAWEQLITNADFQNMIQALHVTASAPGQNGHVSVTAAVPEGYKFLCWLQSITVGWVGNCNPSTQSATTDFYTSVGSGGTLRCWYLVIKT